VALNAAAGRPASQRLAHALTLYERGEPLRDR
jgi:hypothetical protein